MSVLGVKPGEMGNSIVLSRLEKGTVPVTVHISTAKQQVVKMIYIVLKRKDITQMWLLL